MRVLLVNDGVANEGGMETYLTLLRAALAQRGDDVRLLTSSAGSKGNGSADYVAFGATSAAAQAFLQIVNPAALATMRRAVSEFRPDVTLVNMFEMHLSPAIFAALRGVPTVLNIANYKPICPIGLKLLPSGSRCVVPPGLVCVRSGCVGPAHWVRDRPRYALIGRAVGSADHVLTCSAWMTEQLARHGIASTYLPWPSPPVRAGFSREPASQPRFVYLGRLAREKGVDVLLRAFAALVVRVPDARLRVVGTGPLDGALRAEAERLRLGSKVEFVGQASREQVDAELESAWALVAPSLWAEPFGIIALEALARGVPVIATKGGGFEETVNERSTGILVPPGVEGALADALLEVATRRAFPEQTPDVHAAGAVLRRHDLDAHVEALRTLLGSTIEAQRIRPAPSIGTVA
jgi:glycosyltransferase involved in cell wall biosynthesis